MTSKDTKEKIQASLVQLTHHTLAIDPEDKAALARITRDLEDILKSIPADSGEVGTALKLVVNALHALQQDKNWSSSALAIRSAAAALIVAAKAYANGNGSSKGKKSTK